MTNIERIEEVGRMLDKHDKAMERLRDAWMVVPAFIWIKDTENHITFCNIQGAAAMGVKPGLHDISCDEIWPETARKYYANDMDVIAKNKAKLGINEPMYHTEKGRTVQVRTDKLPIHGIRDDRVVGIFVYAVEVEDG